jgi:hypothetical protein
MVTSAKGLGPEKDYAIEGQQHIQKTDLSSRQRRSPTEQDRDCQRVIISGHEPQMGIDTKTY